ncbi:MAG: hypothetical protein SFV19_04235 [Rhodospirillaceae bacterium]|nr:hypothetical protein [Rhodospirillaceae bacterium]
MMPSRRSVIAGLGSIAAAPWVVTPAMAATHNGLIFQAGPLGRCDEDKIGGPIVKWHPTEKTWWMWYYCRDKSWPKDVAPAFGSGRVALAKSDDGIKWTRVDGPLSMGSVFEPSRDPNTFDSDHLASGDVLFHDGEWIMSYFGGDATLPKEIGGVPVPEGYQFKGYRGRPGIARSKDGINWTRVKGKGTGGASVDIGNYIYGGFPNIFHDGKRFLMAYAMLHPRVFYWETHVAESTNLEDWTVIGELKWETEPAIWELGGSVTRHVLRNPKRSGPKWLMTYSALDSRFQFYPRSIAAAGSDDGLTWRRLFDQPVLTKGPVNAWDSAGASYSYLVPVAGKLHLYYYGWKEEATPVEPSRAIGLAISDDGDLTKFLKVPTGT